MQAQRGSSLVAIIVVVVVLAAVVLGGLYFFSDVFRTKADAAWAELAKWTPENIAKDPVGYLNYCETELKKEQVKLQASEIAVSQTRGKFEAAVTDAKGVVATGKKSLDELKAAYTAADAAKSFPIKWTDRTLDQDQAKKQIIRLDREIKSKTATIDSYENSIKTLDVHKGKIQDAKDKASEQLTAIQTGREQLKIKAITDDLKNQFVAMKGVLQTSVIGVADQKSTISLDDIAAKAETSVNEEDFAKIMGSK